MPPWVPAVVRPAVLLLTGVIAGGRVVDACQAWREWHRRAELDPSAADAYRTFLRVDLAVAALSLAVAVLVWWLLRPKVRGVSEEAHR